MCAASVGGSFTASAAGGMTLTQAVGTVISGADCALSVVRDGAKIFLGDEHETVVKVEDNFDTYDKVMFIYSALTFDLKDARTDDILLFANDMTGQVL